MCSDTPVNTHLDAVLAALDEETLVGLIDDPVHETTSLVLNSSLPQPTVEGLQQLVTRFVGLVHEHGWGCHRRPNDADCFALGVDWLRSHYTSSAGTGYSAALADVLALGTDAFTAVVLSLGASTRESQREAYTQWVLCRHVRYLDWEQKREFLRTYLGLFGDGLPPSVTELPVDVLAGRVEELVMLEIGSRREFSGVNRLAATVGVLWNGGRDLPASFVETWAGRGAPSPA